MIVGEGCGIINLMSDRTDSLISLVEPFGVSENEARIYVALLERGVMSALKISRYLKMGRTKVYRVLDGLIEKGLVVQLYNERGFTFEAAAPAKLEMRLKQRRKELEGLEESLPSVVERLEALGGLGGLGVGVRYFEGLAGLEQITLSSLEAKDELLIYEMDQDMSAFVSHEFAEEMRRELVKRKIVTRQLTNKQRIESFTSVREYVRNWWQVRYVDPKLLPIQFEVLVYNSTYCLYTFEGKKVFGVEIEHEQLAAMQKMQFEYVWGTARVLERVGGEGEAALIEN